MLQPDKTPISKANVRVRLLDGGSFSTATLNFLHSGAEPSDHFRMYDWCFLVSHIPTGRHILWDVGLSSDTSRYTPWVLKNMFPKANPVGPRKSLGEQLTDQGISHEDIDTVIFSHAHWDHCRPIKHEFPNATGYFGSGTQTFCSPGHLSDGKPMDSIQWDGRFFDTEGSCTETWQEFDNQNWAPFLTFDKAFDFFGDGSFWIIDSPGHMPGNLGAAARLDDSNEWVLLGGDCCHSRALLKGEADIACYTTPDGKRTAYLHMDLEVAQTTIGRIRKAEKEHGVHVALAHDESWLVTQHDPILMSLLDENKRGEWLERVKDGLEP